MKYIDFVKFVWNIYRVEMIVGWDIRWRFIIDCDYIFGMRVLWYVYDKLGVCFYGDINGRRCKIEVVDWFIYI